MDLNVEIHIEELELLGIPREHAQAFVRALTDQLRARLAEGPAPSGPVHVDHLDAGVVRADPRPAAFGAAVGDALARKVVP